jgi:hypothetical protein
MQHSPSWEADCHPTDQNIPRPFMENTLSYSKDTGTVPYPESD